MELAGEVLARGPGATRFAVGDRVMAIVGGGGAGRAGHRPRAAADAGAGGTRLGRRGRSARGLHAPRTTRCARRRGCSAGSGCSCTAARVASARRRSSSAAPLGARVTATVRNEALRDGVRALGAEVIAPGGLRGARSVRRDPRARRGTEPGRRLQGAGRRRTGERHRRGRRRDRRAEPARADGQAGSDLRLDAAGPSARGEGAHGSRRGAHRAAPVRYGRAHASRSPRRIRSSGPPTPTSASPRAASSARSCSRPERRGAPYDRQPTTSLGWAAWGVLNPTRAGAAACLKATSQLTVPDAAELTIVENDAGGLRSLPKVRARPDAWSRRARTGLRLQGTPGARAVRSWGRARFLHPPIRWTATACWLGAAATQSPRAPRFARLAAAPGPRALPAGCSAPS